MENEKFKKFKKQLKFNWSLLLPANLKDDGSMEGLEFLGTIMSYACFALVIGNIIISFIDFSMTNTGLRTIIALTIVQIVVNFFVRKSMGNRSTV